jgi:transcriptional regulator with XRE-family HTH domain
LARLVGTVPRRRLGRELEKLRDHAGYTLEEAAALLETSISRLSRIENANQAPDVQWVRAMLDLYHCSDRWEELLALTRLAREPGWWRRYGLDDRGYVPLEAGACLVREFSMTTVPGLLQTADYARAVLRSGVVELSEQRRERDVEVRQVRQKRLYSERDPLRLATVIDESALRRAIGGPVVLREQLDHLLIMCELDTVSLQVLPAEVQGHPGLDGSFTVLSFPEPDEPDLAYVEYLMGSAHIERAEDVARCRVTFDRLRAAALNPTESAALIERLASAI